MFFVHQSFPQPQRILRLCELCLNEQMTDGLNETVYPLTTAKVDKPQFILLKPSTCLLDTYETDLRITHAKRLA